jgi:hypothetical protein
MTRPPDDTHARLTRVASRLARLTPDRRDPERFHLEKSELRAELRAIANGPTVVRTVMRPVRVEVAVMPAASEAGMRPQAAPEPPPQARSQSLSSAPPHEGAMPLILTAHEREILCHATTTCTGGFLSGFRRWHNATDPNTGALTLSPDDLKRVWLWAADRGKAAAKATPARSFGAASARCSPHWTWCRKPPT